MNAVIFHETDAVAGQDGSSDQGSVTLEGERVQPVDDTDGSAARRDADQVWRRFEAVVAARQASAAFNAATAASAPLALVPHPLFDDSAPEAGAKPSETRAALASAHPQRRNPWFYRLQGGVMAGFVALGGVTFERLQGDAPLIIGVSPPTASQVDPSTAFADAFAQNAFVEPTRMEQPLAAPTASPQGSPAALGAQAAADEAPEAELIARIAAADPPYRVVLHLAPNASAREVARLETAIRAWGFNPPEQRVAAERITLAEVVFHTPQDREAATIVARIADRILTEAVLTAPVETAPAAAVGDAFDLAGRLDVFVMTP